MEISHRTGSTDYFLYNTVISVCPFKHISIVTILGSPTRLEKLTFPMP